MMRNERWIRLLLTVMMQRIDFTRHVKPSATLHDIISYIRSSYLHDRSTPESIMGLLFARPECKIAKDEIIPSLRYFDVRSGDNIDIFFPGYVEADQANTKCALHDVGAMKWMFDEKLFNEARRDLENRTKWKYSGEADFLLANVKLVDKDVGYRVDFGRVINLDLDMMIREKSIESVPRLLEHIFDFAEHDHSSDPVGKFSDLMGWRMAKKATVAGFWDVMKSLLKIDFRAVKDFAVRDVSK